jgi:hypothetical protein
VVTAAESGRVQLYVAGPMSGYSGFNYPAFFDAETALRNAGYGVLNPARNAKQSSWDGYMRAAIAQVIRADGVAVLPDWQMSAGAALEVHIAHALRVPVHSVKHWVALDEVAA